ncbi:nucleotidyltransferase family protein [Alishewanella sp. SMS8]|uniref:nucleotidyltransferase family protein n=1 Tax=Alishewanella sp. SMS8 TaxID=2994676 RepID=UPI00274079BF|nr:nucleotidyltransferase family protein [Alishewanella sp. SMS8]MDP5459384.1 nucleotidyltransferase family protein [Alishewanella sp. SMS8]
MQFNQLLCQLFVAPESALQLNAQQWVNVILVLRHQQLLARYSYRFKSAKIFLNLSEYAQHHLRNAEILADKQYRQIDSEAEELIDLLEPLNVTPVFLKGAAYALQPQLKPGLGRTFSDIDLLVPKQNIMAIEQRLALFGYLGEPISAYDEHYYRNWTHEIPPVRHHARGTVLDIHHNLVPLVSGRAPNIAAFERHVITTDQGYAVLDLPAITLHSLIHLFFNETFKNAFRDLTDLHLLFSDFSEEDWTEILKLSAETGFQFELMLAVRYCQQLLQTTVPCWVCQQLENGQPAAWRMRLLDFIFGYTLLPKHPLTTSKKQKLAVFFAFVRGHFLKMPLHILLGHLTMKSFFGLRDAIFGKHQFSPKKN